MLVRGDRDKLHGVVTSLEFQRLVTRAGFIAHDLGVVRAVVDDEAVRVVGAMEEATADLE
jgi:ABC-type oligopeptide transport system ATPase subunit